jgi:hypothetical protein
MQTVNNFGGSASAKAQLEASLRSRAGQYANQMIQYQNTEQRKYITGLAQSEIAPIAAMVASDPKALRSSFDQVGVIVSKYADALDPNQNAEFVTPDNPQLWRWASAVCSIEALGKKHILCFWIIQF